MSTAQMKHSLVLRLSAALAFGLAAGASFGYDPSDYSTWYQFSGNKNTPSFTADCWYDPAEGPANMTSAQPGLKYYVPSGIEAGSAAATATFKGESLAVAGTLRYTTSSAIYTVDDLILCPGGTLSEATSVTVAGKLTVKGTSESPSSWGTFYYANRKFYYRPALVGDSTAFLYVGSASDTARDSLFGDEHHITMDMSAYEGEIVFRGLRFFFSPSTSIPGKVTVSGNAILELKKTSGAYDVGSLSFENGAELRAPSANNACAYFSVSTAISFGDTLKVSGLALGVNSYRIAKLTGDAAANAPDVSTVQVEMMDMDEAAMQPRNLHLQIVDNGDNTKDVRVVWDAIRLCSGRNTFNSAMSIPGMTVTVGSDAALELVGTSGASNVSGIEFESGAELRAPSANYDCAYLAVSKTMSFGDVFKISGLDISPTGYRIAKLTGEAAASAPDVSSVQVELLDKAGELPRNPRLEIVDNGDDTKDVRVMWDEIAIMWTQNSNSDSSKNAFAAANGSYWSTGVVPSSDFDGDVYAAKHIMFWNYGATHYDGMTLVLANGTTLYNQTYGLHLKEVQAVGSVKIFGSNGGRDLPNRLYAPLRIYGGTCAFSGGWGNHWTELDGPISGSGTIVLGYSSASGNTVNGDDSGFTGNYTVSGGISLDDPLTRPNFYIGVGGSFAFGGSYTGAEAWRSVYSTNAYYVISADVSMTNETRGVYLNQANVFEVAQNKTLKITEAMTYNGTITKSGAGALVLGNATTKFIASGAQADAPAEGLNGLAVAAGTLEIAAVDAVNGLAVSFGPASSLVVNVGATGDLKTYGARNVKWETPFAADAVIPVVFAGEMTADSDTFAVCTISETAAVPTFAVPAKYAHRKVTALGWRTNDDGSKTYEVALEKQGILLIVR